MNPKTQAVGAIGLAQIIASAPAQYLPAVISEQATADLNLPAVSLFTGFSLALVISAMVGPWAGRLVDQIGGRPVLMLSNVFFAISLIILGFAQGVWGLVLAYAFMGVGLAMGLFEVAFAALVRLFGKDARNTITGITLLAGFASFAGWTVSVYIQNEFGWRGVCWFWAGVHLVIGLPLHALTPKPQPTADLPKPQDVTPSKTIDMAPMVDQAEPLTREEQRQHERQLTRSSYLLAYMFAVSAFVGMGLMMHLPALLQEMGVAVALAFTIGALVGPSQTLGRLIDYLFMRNLHPLIATRWAALCHPIAAALLMMFAAPMAFVFVVLHGLGNGILIIARGHLPLAIFGTDGYGLRQGWLMMPAKLAQAAAPFAFGLALSEWGAGVLWMTLGLGLSVLLSLCLIRIEKKRPNNRSSPNQSS
jgi:predicted MFS family arabinose efflux permease